MKVLGAVLYVVLLHIAGCSDVPYSVPEPLFEVFSPRGFRVSVPDSRDVKSVEFFITVPSQPEPLIHEANHTDGSYWIYWNPDVAVNLYDKIHYKLMIKHCELYWKKEGTHVVQKVLPLSGRSNDTDCAENQGQKVISVFPSLGGVEERNKAMINTGKTTNFKSSYSMHKNSDLKPITKSSTSTTSGTFYIKPSGVMEATGYKSGSTFDSTRREGEQWEHYQSQLTGEELENMRHLYGSGFYGFPHLNDKLFPNSAKIYEKSYMSSESKSFPGEFHKIAYGEGPMTSHQFHQTHKTHESSSLAHSKPAFQFHYGDSAGSGSTGSSLSSHRQESQFRLEPLIQLPHPLPPQGTIVKTTEYVRQEHTVPTGEASQVHLERESHGSSTPQKIVQMSQFGEFSSHNQETNQEIVKPAFSQVLSHNGRTDQLEHQEIVKPAFTTVVSQSGRTDQHEHQEIVKPAFTTVVSHNGRTEHQEIVKPAFTQVFSHNGRADQLEHHETVQPAFTQVLSHNGRTDQLEYNSGNLQTVERQDYRTRHYLGNIFTSVKTSKVKSPQECTLVPGLDFNPTGNVRDVEKFMHELSCLATLAESTMKEEIALLKQRNAEYSRKLEQLEHEVKRFGSKCNCYE